MIITLYALENTKAQLCAGQYTFGGAMARQMADAAKTALLKAGFLVNESIDE